MMSGNVNKGSAAMEESMSSISLSADWMKDDREIAITDLLSYELIRAGNMMTRSAARSYKREFDISLGEWRSLALIADYGPLSLNPLARMSGMDKGQVSRDVSQLVSRELVLKDCSPKGGRAVSLRLTPKGKALHRRIMEKAIERNEAILACLDRNERDVLKAVLSKIALVGDAFAKVEPD